MKRAVASVGTRALLGSGIAAGSLFMLVSLAQAFLRAGFDIRRHPLSLLLLGELGWIQVTNFIGCGLLVVAFAAGVRRMMRTGPAATWGPILIAGFGVGTVIAGIFQPDPSLGFPPGAPAGVPTTMSWHSSVHGLGFGLAFVSATAACFVFARRFGTRGDRRWASYCAATGVATPLIAALGMAGNSTAGVAFAMAGAVAWCWLAAVATELMTEATGNQPAGATPASARSI